MGSLRDLVVERINVLLITICLLARMSSSDVWCGCNDCYKGAALWEGSRSEWYPTVTRQTALNHCKKRGQAIPGINHFTAGLVHPGEAMISDTYQR